MTLSKQTTQEDDKTTNGRKKKKKKKKSTTTQTQTKTTAKKKKKKSGSPGTNWNYSKERRRGKTRRKRMFVEAALGAAEFGNAQAATEALREIEDEFVNAKGEDGDTSLHLACLYGHVDVVKALLAMRESM